MTYLQFHLWFNLPALLILLWLVRERVRRAHWKCIAALCAIVFLATTPWDNWAVHRGFWDFDWRRVTPLAIRFRGVEWRLPAEEYAFFLIETVMVSLFALLFCRRFRLRASHPEMRWHYFVHLVGWAGPLVILQWTIGWRVFRRNLRAVFIPPVVAVVFFGACDSVAIRSGLWTFDPRQISGWWVGGVPFEEALFFLLTSLLVTQSLLLLLPARYRWP